MNAVPHDHTEYVEGCFRCDLSRAEAESQDEHPKAVWPPPEEQR